MSNEHLSMINNLVDHIETNLAEESNILDLANSFGISPWHFQRLFKSLVGDSLGSYIRGRRLSQAAGLLRKTDMGIIDIAMQVGFNSHEAFSRSFKSHFNFTPKELRALNTNFNLKEKPVLTEELLNFLSHRIDSQPEIKTVAAKRVIGFSIEIGSPFVDRIHCSTIAEPWMKLLARAATMVDMSKTNFYGITLSPSGNFTEDTLIYIAGVEVPEDFVKPEDFVETTLPEQQVAIFEVTTNVTNDNLKQKVDSIYGYWLGNSNYDRATGNDYELFRNFVNAEKGQFDAYYVMPVRTKQMKKAV